jgi:probable addiction module antidote protein
MSLVAQQAGLSSVLDECESVHKVPLRAGLTAVRTGKGESMGRRNRDEAMAELFRQDPAYALTLLNSILENDDQGEALITLRQMAKAFGGLQSIAEKAQLNQKQIYRTLSAEGNPALSSLTAILRAMDLRLAVEPAGDESGA